MMTATARKTSVENKDSPSCYHFVIIPSCLWSSLQLDWCAGPWIKYRKLLKIYDCMLQLSSNRDVLISPSLVVLQRMTQKCSNPCTACAEHLFFLTLPIKLLVFGIIVAFTPSMLKLPIILLEHLYRQLLAEIRHTHILTPEPMKTHINFETYILWLLITKHCGSHNIVDCAGC